jgi:hypothetical protein
MKSSSTDTTADRGLRRAVIGGLGVVAVAIVLGLGAFTLLISAQRTVSPDQLVGRDTQFYLWLKPNLREAANIALLRERYGPLFDDGVPSPAGLLIDDLLDVDYSSDVARWIGPDMALAIRGLDAANPPATLEELSERAELVFIFASRDDPTAARFLDQQLTDRKAKGQRFRDEAVGLVTIHVQEDGGTSPVAAFALLKHYVVYSNSVDAIRAMVERDPFGQDTLVSEPRYDAVREAAGGDLASFVYADRPAVQSLINMAVANDQQSDQYAALAEPTNVALAVTLVPAGVQMDAIAPLARNIEPLEAQQVGRALLAVLQAPLRALIERSGQQADFLGSAEQLVAQTEEVQQGGMRRQRLLLPVE